MSAILIAILALTAFGFAFYPLFREEQFADATEGGLNPELENLLSAREATYSAIKDLESDHTQGKLSDADYQNLRVKYETKALTILQRLEVANQQVTVKARRPALEGNTCAQCGELFNARDKFCHRCGVNLVPMCAACGETIKAGAKFCGRCGTPLGAPACVNCGAAIQAEWKFCKKCGAPIAALQPA